MDHGEEPHETVRREIREETGLEVGEIRPYKRCPYVNTLFDSGKQYITLYFEAEYLGGEPRVMEPEKCAKWEWFTPDALPKPLFAPLEANNLNLAGPDDEGELEIRIGVEKGIVVLDFGKAIKWIGLGSAHARAMAETLVKWADEADAQ